MADELTRPGHPALHESKPLTGKGRGEAEIRTGEVKRLRPVPTRFRQFAGLRAIENLSAVRRARATGFALEVERSIRSHWRVILAEGVVLSLLGLLAVVVPPILNVRVTPLVGWLFAVAGISSLVGVLAVRGAPGFIWSLLSAATALVAGGLLLWSPLRGSAMLGFVLTAYFLVDGVSTIAISLSLRRELAGRWEWMLMNGILDLFFAGLIVAEIPYQLDWALALLFGFDLLFGGGALVAMGLDARKSSWPPAQRLTSPHYLLRHK